MDIRQLQAHIKEFDHDPEQKHHYFLKLIEEVGELSESIRKEATGQPTEDTIKGTIAEELYDTLYYICALANVYEIDLEKTHQVKEILNKRKYNR